MNVERSGDRNEFASWLMRQPGYSGRGQRKPGFEQMRSIDDDESTSPPYRLCNECCSPIFVCEITRNSGEKPTRYTVAYGKRWNAPALLIRRGWAGGSKRDALLRVTLLWTPWECYIDALGEEIEMSVEEFVSAVEGFYLDHEYVCEGA